MPFPVLCLDPCFTFIALTHDSHESRSIQSHSFNYRVTIKTVYLVVIWNLSIKLIIVIYYWRSYNRLSNSGLRPKLKTFIKLQIQHHTFHIYLTNPLTASSTISTRIYTQVEENCHSYSSWINYFSTQNYQPVLSKHDKQFIESANRSMNNSSEKITQLSHYIHNWSFLKNAAIKNDLPCNLLHTKKYIKNLTKLAATEWNRRIGACISNGQPNLWMLLLLLKHWEILEILSTHNVTKSETMPSHRRKQCEATSLISYFIRGWQKPNCGSAQLERTCYCYQVRLKKVR